MSRARQVAWNTVAQALARVVTAAFGAVTVVLLTRHLGVDGYGSYVAATAYALLLTAFADWGIATLLARDLSQQWDRAQGTVANALALRLFLSLPILTLAALAIPLVFAGEGNAETRRAAVVALPLVVVLAVSTTLTAIFQAKLALQRVALAEVVAQAATLLLVVATLLAGRGVYAVVAATVTGLALQAALLALLARRFLPLSLGFDFASWRRMLVRSLPLGIALILNTLYFRIDALLLAALREPHEVGIYGVAYRFLELLTAFPFFFVSTVFPLLAAAVHDGNLDLVRGIAQRSFDVLAAAAVPLVFGIVAIAPELVELVGGDEFAAAAAPLRMIAVGAGLIFVNGLLGYLLIAADRQRAALWLNVAVLVFNVALNLALIPRYGYNAAADVATASEILIVAGTLMMARRFVGFVPSPRVTLKALVAGAAVFAVATLAGSQVESAAAAVVAAVVGGAIAYGASAMALGIHRDVELWQLRSDARLPQP